jgi:hypothetical protein
MFGVANVSRDALGDLLVIVEKCSLCPWNSCGEEASAVLRLSVYLGSLFVSQNIYLHCAMEFRP